MPKQFEVYLLPKISAIVAVVTIIICYILATQLKHVQPWLPDITHCARYAPERFIFRIGMIPAASAISLMWFVVWGWVNNLAVSRPAFSAETPEFMRTYLTLDKDCRLACTLGAIAGGCLVVSSSVLESDGSTVWPIHVLCATSFFILMLVAQILLTYRLYTWSQAGNPVISEGSLWLKMGGAGFTACVFLADLYCQIQNYKIMSNLCEWTMTFTIVAYNLTFVGDWKGRVFVTFPEPVPAPAAVEAPAPTTTGIPMPAVEPQQTSAMSIQLTPIITAPQQYHPVYAMPAVPAAKTDA